MDRSSSTTVAKFIRRFRDSQPLSREDRREERESLEGDIWWTRSQERGFSASTPAPNSSNKVVKEGKRPQEEEPAFFSDPRREDHREDQRGDHETRQEDPGHNSESDDAKGGPQTAEETPVSAVPLISPTSPQGRPLCTKPSTGLAEGGPNALDAAIDELRTVAAVMLATTNGEDILRDRKCRPASGNCVTAATSSPGVCSDSYERKGDELASLDTRARTLLEDCRRVLASPPSASHKELLREGRLFAEQEDTTVGTCKDSNGSCSIESLEERAWLLLNDQEEQAVHPSNTVPSSSREGAELFVPRKNLVDLPCAGESPFETDCGGMQMLTPQHDACWTAARRRLAEEKDMYPCQRGPGCEGGALAEARHSGNLGLDLAFEKRFVGKDSLLDEKAGSISTFASANEGVGGLSPLALATSEEEAEYFRKDPILSALLRRFDEIENELEWRRSPRREDEPNDDFRT
ncbi:unnamed protein product [Scytosiphon promiscuus]